MIGQRCWTSSCLDCYLLQLIPSCICSPVRSSNAALVLVLPWHTSLCEKCLLLRRDYITRKKKCPYTFRENVKGINIIFLTELSEDWKKKKENNIFTSTLADYNLFFRLSDNLSCSNTNNPAWDKREKANAALPPSSQIQTPEVGQ